MKRLIVFLLRAVVLVVLAVWLADRPGTARIDWHGYVIETSAAFLGLAVLATAFVLYLLFRVWHVLRHGPELWSLNRRLKNMRQGQDFLTQGLTAIASGNAAEAGRLAIAARKKLGVTTATLLLQAQAAQQAHDHRAAQGIFRAMIEDENSAALGYRGLIMEARRTGDRDEVERLVTEAGRLKTPMPWLEWIRFETATQRQSWLAAGEALDRLAPTKLLESATLGRHRAALLLAQSRDEARQGLGAAALEAAEKATRQTPLWLPALINLAQRQAAGNHARAARRTVEKAWKLQPHSHLAEVLRSNGAEPIAHYKQIERLCRDHEDGSSCHLLLAEAALAADIWGEARRHLMLLVTRQQATQNVYRLLARLERRESGDERAALAWLTKSIEAPPDFSWLCSACGNAHNDWQPTCRACGAFATLDWRRPGSGTEVQQPLLRSPAGWLE